MSDLINRKVTEEEMLVDDLYDIRKAIAESGEASDWDKVESIPVADLELELEADEIGKAVCPCSYGICDEKESCPLYK